jgi:NAD(P)-dependent dehydrogenase (short-subunit alcohol dehydrogenase family)
MKDVEGKVAFITGAANGIGLGMAKTFLAAGMKVVIADIRQDHLDRAMGQLHNRSAHAIQLDVTDRTAMARAADEAEKVFGKVHVVCNNAGINLFASIDNCTYDDWDWVLGVNLGGVVNGVQTFLPRIRAHGEGGHIVNTASMAAFVGSSGAGIYTTAKFAVRGLTESLRPCVARYNIGVSMLNPGLVNSNIHHSDEIRPENLTAKKGEVDAGFMARLEEIQKLGMDPEEVGAKVLQGIRNNDLYIFSHPEFKEETRETFEKILAAMPDGEADPKRLAFEEFRRARKAAEQG